MSDYQVIARKFRPQSFKDVIGQEAIVTTLIHAIKFNRLAQAYLFCGSRGTGKTTLARLLAKALNCQSPATDYEPCNQCSSCREITAGSSLDVLEIDGASHRGIEDIRQINETVGYIASGNYKIYIIDEVHMLTKEAFNALLKTLEEPPPKVKFLFATTEPHKVPPTILSRCQRFNLNRIPQTLIMSKLRRVASQLEVEVEEEALRLLALRAEGGLRDAESLFDQILAFEEGRVTVDSVTAILGLMPREIYFEIDLAGKEGHFLKAFEIAHRIFSEGKDISFFIEGLIDHLRHIMLVKVSGTNSAFMTLTESEKEKYAHSASFYSREQCLDLIEYLLEAQNQLRTTVFGKIALEAILLHVMRSHFRLSIEQLVRHLSDLEKLIQDKNEKLESTVPHLDAQPKVHPKISSASPFSSPTDSATKTIPAVPSQNAPSMAKMEKESAPPIIRADHSASPIAKPVPLSTQKPASPPLSAKANSPEVPQTLSPPPHLFSNFVSEDPTPSPADLGKKNKATTTTTTTTNPLPQQISSAPPSPAKAMPVKENQDRNLKLPLHSYDTLMHFAAVELEGRLQKN